MEGKTLTTINLGITMAMDFNQTVMLVDADLRRQKLHQYLGISVQYGLVDHLINKRPLSDSIVWPGIEKLSIISGSKRYRNSSEILGSSQMKRLIQEMKGRYKDRYILFDTAPVLSGADAIVFAPYVDCILMVVRSGKTKRRELSKALEVIPPEKLIGFVLNDHARAFEGYYYYY
jgi:non-specific protein-tyrosine kinase